MKPCVSILKSAVWSSMPRWIAAIELEIQTPTVMSFQSLCCAGAAESRQFLSSASTAIHRYFKLYVLISIVVQSLYSRSRVLLKLFDKAAPPTVSSLRTWTATSTRSHSILPPNMSIPIPLTKHTSTSLLESAPIVLIKPWNVIAKAPLPGTAQTGATAIWHLAFLSASAGVILYFAVRLWQARSFFRRLQKAGMPMPPHHFLWGHLGLMLGIMLELPRDVMPTVALADQVRRRHPHLDRAFYLDLWPFTGPTLVVLSPNMLRQATQGENALPKVGFLKGYMRPISGGHDLVTMEGEEWRRWRDVFRPAFSRATRLMPGIVDSICVFRDRLVEIARNSEKADAPFQLHPLALKLAMDMSGKVLYNHDMKCQTSYNDMADAMVSQLGWLLVDGFMPFGSLNFIRPLVHKYNGYRMERYISMVQREMSSRNSEDSCVISQAITRAASSPGSKKEHSEQKDPYRHLGGQEHFDTVIRSQMRFLLLAGYDTTGASITYVLHMLSKYPEVLTRVREEHNQVLGPDLTQAAQKLRDNPHIVNCVPYTTAVIKETLRLYPPTSTLRNGQRGVYLVDDVADGGVTRLPTEGCMVVGNHHGLHHNPRYWKDPEVFQPERFLVGSDDPSQLHPLQDSWRPVSCLVSISQEELRTPSDVRD